MVGHHCGLTISAPVTQARQVSDDCQGRLSLPSPSRTIRIDREIAGLPLVVIGTNHRTAPVDIREKVVFAGEELPEALRGLTSVPGVREALIVSTCNRTELYCVAEPEGAGGATLDPTRAEADPAGVAVSTQVSNWL